MATNKAKVDLTALLGAADRLTAVAKRGDEVRGEYEGAFRNYVVELARSDKRAGVTRAKLEAALRGRVPFAASDSTLNRDVIVGEVLSKAGSLDDYRVTLERKGAPAQFFYMREVPDSDKRESAPVTIVARPDAATAVGTDSHELSLCSVVDAILKPRKAHAVADKVGKPRIMAAIRKAGTVSDAVDALVAFLVGYQAEADADAAAKKAEAEAAEEADEAAETSETTEAGEDEGDEDEAKDAAQYLTAGGGIVGAAVKAAQAGRLGDIAALEAALATHEAALAVIREAIVAANKA